MVYEPSLESQKSLGRDLIHELGLFLHCEKVFEREAFQNSINLPFILCIMAARVADRNKNNCFILVNQNIQSVLYFLLTKTRWPMDETYLENN